MFPPPQGLTLDIEAISGICGSISVACWVVVFSPQIIENFKRGSADGLSLLFLVVWLLGDVFNILGAVLQGVLPTMVILAVYYTVADLALLGQCFWYRGIWSRGAGVEASLEEEEGGESAALLGGANGNGAPALRPRRRSSVSFITSVDGTHLSPATPLLDPSPPSPPTSQRKPTTALQAFAFNTTAVFLVCFAGIFGWWVSTINNNSNDNNSQPSNPPDTRDDDTLQFSPLGQLFGYLCALLYLGSRIPQILLNHRRKSTEGISMLFFLFACIGNLTYVLSIFAYDPKCPRRDGGDKASHCDPAGVYARYILVNASWLAGSLGTLILDLGIFVQFFWYREGGEGLSLEEGEGSSDDDGSVAVSGNRNGVR
ncbi:hypothetical protein FGG08_003299 [Glutinoglossum americanum]|uniref:PQ-loop-domain-containing protein n=1 Tax=Glutinoglossum americanum TaxID=1670608 RepID=A0A9P8I2T4_9PEZI|nr:hypothetical protein FGG08_003299 [Glutinoglossum americanum]